PYQLALIKTLFKQVEGGRSSGDKEDEYPDGPVGEAIGRFITIPQLAGAGELDSGGGSHGGVRRAAGLLLLGRISRSSGLSSSRRFRRRRCWSGSRRLSGSAAAPGGRGRFGRAHLRGALVVEFDDLLGDINAGRSI